MPVLGLVLNLEASAAQQPARTLRALGDLPGLEFGELLLIPWWIWASLWFVLALVCTLGGLRFAVRSRDEAP